MSLSTAKLIEALQARNADRPRATDGGMTPKTAFPPVTPKALQRAERALGFELPELLREVYLKVANGGFGPSYGLVGMEGGCQLDKCTLETCYLDMFKLTRENPAWKWPERLLPIANYGCGMWSCVDCTYKRLPMLLWDPNNLESDIKGTDAEFNWRFSFWDESHTLKSWFNGWLTLEPSPEPKWPSASWSRKRLGFTHAIEPSQE